MKALVYQGNKILTVEQNQIPVINQNECLIRVAYAGICGSDMLLWNGGYPRVKPPLTIGHEFSGTIAKVGENVTRFKEGNPVVVNPLIVCETCESCRNGNHNICDYLNLIGIDKDGGMATYVVATEQQISYLPHHISMANGAFTEPLAVGVHMVRTSMLQKGETALIVGAGPVGLIAAYVAKIKGANVYVSEMNPFRLKKAAELGFNVINSRELDVESYIHDVTNGSGVHVAFEVTGSNPGLVDCINTVKPKGTVLIAGMASQKHAIETYKIIQKEINMTGSRVYTREDFKEAIRLINDNLFDPTPFISRIVTLDNVIADGFESIEKGDPVLKILVDLEAEDK